MVGDFNITATSASGAADFGVGLGSIVLDEVMCEGDEERLIDCPNNGLHIHDCSHSEDAAVHCHCKDR